MLRVYQQNNRDVVPVNPKADEVEGLQPIPIWRRFPAQVDGVSIITPPAVTERVVQDAVERGIKNIWMQPGAESEAAIEAAEECRRERHRRRAVHPGFAAITATSKLIMTRFALAT